MKFNLQILILLLFMTGLNKILYYFLAGCTYSHSGNMFVTQLGNFWVMGSNHRPDKTPKTGKKTPEQEIEY